MKTKISIIVLACVALGACAFLVPELQVPKIHRGWYNAHRLIMGSKMPWWLSDKDITEDAYFRKLPLDHQKKYIELFWSMRFPGREEEYKARIFWADRLYREGGTLGRATDRGWVFILCGLPIDAMPYPDETSITTMQNLPRDIEGMSFLVWSYPCDGRVVCLYFNYTWGGNWRLSSRSAVNSSEMSNLFKGAYVYWAPMFTEEWEQWIKEHQ